MHIPFCAQRCAYCNFILTTRASEVDKSIFINGLEKQLQYTLSRYGRQRFDTVYFGGGTPSELTSPQIDDVFEILKRNDGCEISADSEMTVEMNPADVRAESVDRWMFHGMNRVSLGAQSFNPDLLKKINRNHCPDDIFNSIKILRKAGIENISLDLIIRLPGQTAEDVRNACRISADLQVSQVVIYDLEVHERTVFGTLQKQKKLILPDADHHLEMYESAQKILSSEHGYDQYEILSFAKPGFQSKHNLKYWHNQEYLGLGPGAFSYLNQTRYQYCSTVDRFLEKTQNNDFSNDSEDVLSESEIETETLLTGLRLKEGVQKNRFIRIAKTLTYRVKPLIERGFMRESDTRYFLTPEGVRVAEDVFMELSDIAVS
ncbi:MAG: radical SAM family heme chaperone HemW [Candidatus Omnitrophica bacterium]|nr:radical SAM family heme chaperone HemW [Candidatus Omnitrophota bacterium]